MPTKHPGQPAAHGQSPQTSKHAHIKVDGVSFAYPGRRVLTDVSLTVPAGRVTGLIGENGAGKSTLLGLISGRLSLPGQARPADGSGGALPGPITKPPQTGTLTQETSLSPTAPAQTMIDAAIAELRAIEREISSLGQQMGEATNSPATQDALAEAFDSALSRAEMSGAWDVDVRVATVLSGLGLDHVPLETPLGAMSGGQRRRFAMATLLLKPYEAMVLDEPTNHLDDDAMDFLIEELRAFQGPVLVASHDRYFLDAVADSLVDLDPAMGEPGQVARQGTAYSGSFSDYLKVRQKTRARWLERYHVQEQERARLRNVIDAEEGDVFHHSTAKTEVGAAKKFYADRAAKTLGGRIRSARNKLEALERDAIPAPPLPLRFRGIPEIRNRVSLGEPAVVARSLGVIDRLAPVSFKLQPGEQLLVEGPNGVGKSTLLSLIDASLAPDRGELRVAEELRVARLAQDDRWTQDQRGTRVGELFAALSAEAGPTLPELGLLSEEQNEARLGELSMGQRRRVSLGLILANPPDLLLLDEPTNHLSLALAEELETALEEFPGAVLLATHDRWVRRRWKHRVLELG